MSIQERDAAMHEAVSTTHVRFVMSLEARNKLPEAFKACITMIQVTRDTLAVAEGKWEALSALLFMSGAQPWREGNPGAFQKWYMPNTSIEEFIASKDEVDVERLLSHLTQ